VPETLALVDEIAEIPMWGINRSLNVIVSAAIVGYHILVNT
jgi:tRNA G18 (ribose-2'-O)-methylase SpoU